MAQGSLTAETFAEGDDDRMREPEYPGDFADFKLSADVMLRATCYPKGGKAVPTCPVRIAVGNWSKVVNVVGRRVASEGKVGTAVSNPFPFAKMPLGLAESFGGPNFPDNPVGKGYGTPEMPNIEPVDGPMLDSDGLPRANGLGPINSQWASRRRKVGKLYGESYRKNRAPFYSEDFDWSYFSCAAPEQRLPTYLRGDEDLFFQNLHPEASEWSAKLPGLRVRAFVKDTEQVFREVRMNLDTLFADTDKGTLALTWRGLDAVREDDLKDVQTVLVATEALGEPLPESHYREALEAFERDPYGLDQLPPELKAAQEELAAMNAPAPPASPEPPPNPLAALFANAKLDKVLGGKAPPQVKSELDKAFASISDAAKKNAVDLEGSIASATQPSQASPLRRAFDALDKPIEEARKSGQNVEQLDHYETAKKDPVLARLIAIDPPPGPGADLSGRDLMHADLAGLDLRGANFTEAFLTGANLSGANLEGACFKKAIAQEIDVRGANLTRTDLSDAVFVRAKAKGAIFDGARLLRTLFIEADLEEASFVAASGSYPIFNSARMNVVRAQNLELTGASLYKTDISGADFHKARLTSCLLMDVVGKEVRFLDASLTKSSFENGALEDAVFVGASGSLVSFRGATLHRADFRWARLTDPHFGEAIGDGTLFYGADLRGGHFYRVRFENSTFTQANLMGANFSKALINGSKFHKASLFEANLMSTVGRGCDFSEANIKRVRFDAQ